MQVKAKVQAQHMQSRGGGKEFGRVDCTGAIEQVHTGMRGNCGPYEAHVTPADHKAGSMSKVFQASRLQVCLYSLCMM